MKSQTRCLIRPAPNCSCTHTLAAFPLDNTVALCLPDTDVLWDHQWVSFAFTARRRQERGHALVWYFFLAASPVKDGEVHTTLKCSQECMLWDELDRATFSGWFILCGSQYVLGQGHFWWELDHKTQADTGERHPKVSAYTDPLILRQKRHKWRKPVGSSFEKMTTWAAVRNPVAPTQTASWTFSVWVTKATYPSLENFPPTA